MPINTVTPKMTNAWDLCHLAPRAVQRAWGHRRKPAALEGQGIFSAYAGGVRQDSPIKQAANTNLKTHRCLAAGHAPESCDPQRAGMAVGINPRAHPGVTGNLGGGTLTLRTQLPCVILLPTHDAFPGEGDRCTPPGPQLSPPPGLAF